MTYEIDAHADPEAVQAAVRQAIRTADPTDVPPRDWQVVSLALRDSDGAIVGGLYGATMWSWLMIDGLWVAEALRGQGLGSRLLLAAEDLAVSRGCRGSWLGTFDFQARNFYRAARIRFVRRAAGLSAGAHALPSVEAARSRGR